MNIDHHSLDNASNPLKSRDDFKRCMLALFEPLLSRFSASEARVDAGHRMAHFDRAANELEGFARPLWGLAGLNHNADDFEHWSVFLQGLIAGTDPQHPDYWGIPLVGDQRFVEMAPLAFAIWRAPEQLWIPLTDAQKSNVINWLRTIETTEISGNNWLFFRVLVQSVIRKLGFAINEAIRTEALNLISDLYQGDGWYGDGPGGFIDHYNGFAFHYYTLLLLEIEGETAELQPFKERTKVFASNFALWFADNGSALPIGRSMTYRFAMGSFWGALASYDGDILPLGVVKGLWANHLRWWLATPLLDESGRLDTGFAYPNQLIGEEYNSANSSYWSFKFFMPMHLPSDHEFWHVEEQALCRSPDIKVLDKANMLIRHVDGEVFATTAGPIQTRMRNTSDKYGKFAYSTLFGFAVESTAWLHLDQCGDNLLAFSDVGRFWHTRENITAHTLHENGLVTSWSAGNLANITTIQVVDGQSELRLHFVEALDTVQCIESGYAVPRWAYREFNEDLLGVDSGIKPFQQCLISGNGRYSSVRDLATPRIAQIASMQPNTHILFAQACVPVLKTVLPAGMHLIAMRVDAGKGDGVAVEHNQQTLPQWALDLAPNKDMLEQLKSLPL